MPVKASFIEYDEVVQALTANGSDDSFHVSTLPWRAWRDRSCLIPMPGLGRRILSRRFDHDLAADSGCGVPGKGFPELVNGPFRGRVVSHGKVEYPPAVMCQDEKHIQDLKPDRRDRKKIGHHALKVVLQEGPPVL